MNGPRWRPPLAYNCVPVRIRFHSLRARLISRYLVILGIGGLATSIVGSVIVSSTLAREARRAVEGDLGAARLVYQEQLAGIQRTIELAASGGQSLESIRRAANLDFVGVARAGDAPRLAVAASALAGRAAAGAEVLESKALERENPELAGRARIGELDRGLVLAAAYPASGGALYGGVLLNRNRSIVDRVPVFRSDFSSAAVTLFLGDTRIATTIRGGLGTRGPAPVSQAVLAGRSWRGRTLAVGEWYLASYEPLRDVSGRVVGMLAAGVPESAYTSIRNRVILSFFGIATIGFIFIVSVTYYMIRSITGPIAQMAEATEKIAAGKFDEEVPPNAVDEIAHLARSFNTMLASLRQMKGDLEEWGRTLEQKVKQRSDELVSMQARMAQSERLASLGLLAAGVAHEINNPLGAILALTALVLEETPKDDANRESLEEVVKQAQRCRDIVRGLLDFSRQSQLATGPVDLNAVLTDTLSLVARQAHFLNIAVTTELGSYLPPVTGDRSQLQQVFLNILMNAVQAMGEQGKLILTTRRVDGFVEALVRDSGPGIPADHIDRIFDPFFTTKESRKGTGLGLSIAYGIVQKHGGTIAVRSEPGEGATFIVRLPVAAEAARSKT